MDRSAILQQLAAAEFDLLVIGGGITGAGVAREAALRGRSVALLERADFAVGTSSRSTKLVHGGLRYLKNFDLGLVRESLHERAALVVMAPHLVKPVPFLFPVYQGDPDGLWKLRLGMILYDWLAGSRRLFRHRIYPAPALLTAEPLLAPAGLTGGATYCDCVTDDARLTIEVVVDAAEFGATVLNYGEVVAFQYDATSQVCGVQVRDRLGGGTIQVRGRRVLNAGGPWLDAVRRLDRPDAPPLLHLTKGVHLTVAFDRLPLRSPVVMRGPDGRLMFAVPRNGCTYLGTTETEFVGSPEGLSADDDDIHYVLTAANYQFPGPRLSPADVTSSWAGVRPLIGRAGAAATNLSREFALFTSPTGLVSAGGGKLTTFRAMAERIVDHLCPGTPRQPTRSRAPLSGGRDVPSAAAVAATAAQVGWPEAEMAVLAARYGARFTAVLAERRPGDGEVNPRAARLRAEARYAARWEAAQQLLDVLQRRTDELLFAADNGRGVAAAVAGELAHALGWSPERITRELAAYEQALAHMLPTGLIRAEGGQIPSPGPHPARGSGS